MTDSLRQPQRQSPIAVVANIFSVQALQAFIPVAILAFGNRPIIGLIALPVVLILLVSLSALAWSRTTFWVEGGEMILEKGILNKSRTQIPLDRIQQIATEQGLVQQMFNVRKVSVDSAGTAASEFSLAALTDDVVAELRARVVGADKVGIAAPPTSPVVSHDQSHPDSPPAMHGPFVAAHPQSVPSQAVPIEDRRTMVLRHEFADLVQLALSRPSPQVIFGLFALGGLGLGGIVERFLTENITGIVGVVLLAVAVIISAVIILVVGTMVREFQLTVWRSEEGLRLTAGLLNKRERLARTQRVQFVRRRSNFIERRFGRTSLYLPQASSVQVETGTSIGQFAIPGAPDDKANDIAELFLSPNRPKPDRTIDKRIINRKTLLEGVLPAAILLGVAAVVWSIEDAENWFVAPLAVGALFVLVQARISAVLFHRHWSWNVNDGHVVLQNGFVTVERTEAAVRKVQSVRIRQGIWQRRKNLASVMLGTAGGSFTIPHIHLDEATDLRDELLLGVETDIGAWM